MIIIKVELHSAINHKITELARMKICNDGTGGRIYRNYFGQTFKGRCKEQLDRETIQKQTSLNNWPSERFHIWNLVAKMLKNLGYTEGQ